MPTVEEALQQGWQLHQSGRVHDAESIYRGVLAQYPKHAAALVYLGIAFFDQRRFEESATAYQNALNIQPQFPIAWNNLGNSLRMQGKTEEAEVALARALEQQPGYLSALKNRGTLWIWAGEVERGLKWYQEGLSFDPNNAELHRNLGVIHLLLGNYDIGWPEYRWRWRMPGLARPACSAPIWNGEDLHGKSILLYSEQGRGDAIQFIRLAPILANAGAHVVVQCDPVMIPLFSCIQGIESLLPEGMTPPVVDYQASFVEAVDYRFQQIGALPYGTELSGPQGQYIAPPHSLINYWNHWLASNTRGQRIGINWQGNPDHHADVYRSIPLETLASLATRPDTTLVNLQFGHGSEQLESCSFGEKIVRLPSPLDQSGGAFMDTAAIVASLDVIVTTDTAIAHLAGALGKRVLLMLGKVPDWRWLTTGDSTPWYPSMKLIRQTQLGDWSTVVDAVVQELSKLKSLAGPIVQTEEL